jgi:serine/threonine protein kinase
MQNALPLQPGDPAHLGGHRVLGRLGSGGQGVVYLAESGDGIRVAVKVLHASDDPEADARFRREAEVLPRIASFCTAQVLQVGTAGGLPYIVSEYIEGPTLQQAVRDRGPLRGRELRRVAVGTVTALAAIHRAGVVHRDFKPANVLLSRDGPRVIDFGIARAVDAEATGEGIIGTPAYMAPEHLGDAPPGPAADLFAWGAVMIFAASGHPPFGTDGLAAIMRRILMEEPDLGALDGDLREIVAQCLAKDPAERPAAGQVLFRLLGQPAGEPERTAPVRLLAEGTEAAGAVTGATTERRRGWVRPIAAVMTAGALTAAVTIFALNRQDANTSTTSSTSSFSSSSPAPSRSAPAPGSGTAAGGRLAVPELNATFYERPSDPIRLTSFVVKKNELEFPAYVRLPGQAEFQQLPEFRDPVVSPDGTTVAAVYWMPEHVPDNANAAWITDRATGATFSVPTVDQPLLVRAPQWSRDGRRLLLTVSTLGSTTKTPKRTVGFVVVDVAARRSTYTRVSDPHAGGFAYSWGPDGSSVIRPISAAEGGIRGYALDGSVLRTYRNVRSAGDLSAGFSPSGRLLAALCPEKALAACVVDAKTGERRARFTLPADGALWDWFDEDHLLVFDKRGDSWRADVVDLTGKPVRLFAEFTGTNDTFWQVHFTAS